jgi:hypothetical protein
MSERGTGLLMPSTEEIRKAERGKYAPFPEVDSPEDDFAVITSGIKLEDQLLDLFRRSQYPGPEYGSFPEIPFSADHLPTAIGSMDQDDQTKLNKWITKNSVPGFTDANRWTNLQIPFLEKLLPTTMQSMNDDVARLHAAGIPVQLTYGDIRSQTSSDEAFDRGTNYWHVDPLCYLIPLSDEKEATTVYAKGNGVLSSIGGVAASFRPKGPIESIPSQSGVMYRKPNGIVHMSPEVARDGLKRRVIVVHTSIPILF